MYIHWALIYQNVKKNRITIRFKSDHSLSCGAGSAHPFGAPDLKFLVGFVLMSLQFSLMCCVHFSLSVCLLCFSHGVASLYSIYVSPY